MVESITFVFSFLVLVCAMLLLPIAAAIFTDYPPKLIAATTLFMVLLCMTAPTNIVLYMVMMFVMATFVITGYQARARRLSELIADEKAALLAKKPRLPTTVNAKKKSNRPPQRSGAGHLKPLVKDFDSAIDSK